MTIPPDCPDPISLLDPPGREALDTLLARLAARRHRGLVWISAPPDIAIARALSLYQATGWAAPLWLGAPSPEGEAAGIAALPAAKARKTLGGEHDLVVIDAVSAMAGFDPEAFGAVSGTLRAGGLLLLLTPPDFGARPDGDYARLAEHPYVAEALSSRYLARLARLLSASEEVATWGPDGALRLPETAGCGAQVAADASREAATADADCATADQARAVARLMRLKRRRPLVLTADRGRGKSAALGIACARLLAGGETEILVTAPRPAAVEALFERLTLLCPGGRRQGNVFVLEAAREAQDDQAHEKAHERAHDSPPCVSFVAPDALVEAALAGEQGGAGALLLVDEAAAIPAPLLSRMLGAFPRIAFATTVHGYEGSGRGFALRFREQLDRQTPGWQGLHLATPIRWAAEDPLERLTDRLLLLDAEPDEASKEDEPDETDDNDQTDEPGKADTSMGEEGEPTIVECSRDALAADEPRLRALFSLLVQAHYRTQPSDLRRLLDGPGGRVVCLGERGKPRPRAVALTVDEGGFAPELAEQVARGERRPRGHLLAQSLAAHAGSRAALTSRVRRVMRIAVDPRFRRLGHGRALLGAELARASDDGIDLFGASFGAEAGLMAFWQRSGFRAVRLGLTREAASGEHALMVARATSPRGEALLEELTEGFQALLPSLLAFELRAFDPALAAGLLAEGPVPALDAAMMRDIADVAFGHRSPALARPALQDLVRRGLVLRRQGGEAAGATLDEGGLEKVSEKTFENVSDEDAWLLVAVLFQGQDDAWLARRLGLPGRRQVEARLRTTLGRWYRRFVSPT
ncbi:GNAT family N-acetyltransferase [Halomonas sp. YLGW01]|uniref:tRNA(Met) cytidine acetyltransferase TmcA n=1 Tax=Halomonas sp. YLGW01 TaxID=2773308 RepID=UPI00177CF81B|nr:GNAT family N-acetyltransferase [Halomonas sp. YLGW01]